MPLTVDIQTKLLAIADLEAGQTIDAIMARYEVSRSSVYLWKKKWDAGELSDEDAEPQAPEPEPAPEPAQAPTPPTPQDAPEPETMAKQQGVEKRGTDPKKGGLVTKSGTVLPPFPPQQEGNGRNSYPEEFKYALGKALLSREVSVAEVSKHYILHDSLLRGWSEAVRLGKLKGPAKKAATNGHAHAAASKAHAARQTELSIAPAPEVMTTELVPYREPAQPQPMHPAQLYAELESLRRDNRRLRRKLEAALNMVLDDHGDEDDADPQSRG